MAKFKPQYRRLLFIDAKIRDGACPNCTSLAAEWEVTTRTIRRDLDYLKWELGAPLAYDPVRHGFYYTEKDYRLPAVNISESDLFAVCIAERALRQFENTPLYGRLQAVFSKIEASLPAKVTVDPAWLGNRISFFPEPATRIDPAVWQAIATALRECRRVDITHKAPGRNEPSKREVDPYHLVRYNGEWYVVGFCHRAGTMRTFALSRIRQARLLEQRFAMPSDFDLRKLAGDHFGIMWGGKGCEVRVRFAPQLAPYIEERRWHPTQRLSRQKDGSIVFRCRVNHLKEIKDWIRSWGAGARALAPPELVDEIQSDFRRALAAYRKPGPRAS